MTVIDVISKESYFLVLGPNGPIFLCVIFFGGKAGTVWSLELGLELGLTRDHLVPRLVGGITIDHRQTSTKIWRD